MKLDRRQARGRHAERGMSEGGGEMIAGYEVGKGSGV